MSIFIKNVTWSQTETDIIVIVPICGRKSMDDVVIGERFLKINRHPYFYEVFFEHPICVEQSSCKNFESNFKFQLKKVNNEWWQNLGKTSKPAPDSNDEPISIEAKKEIYTNYEDCVTQQCANRKKERANMKRNEMDKEMQRQSRLREKINETEAALKSQQISKVKNSDDTAICSAAAAVKNNNISMLEKRKNEVQPMLLLPPVRSSATISVNLSSRQFVTPSRESQDSAEREWCAKQHEIMVNRIGFSDDDLNNEERDLNWLIQKANAFLEKKNYLAAVSAFSCGLKIANDSPELFLGRAKAQFVLKNYRRCAEDCSKALEHFKPAVESNLLQRIQCFWLRGKSLIGLGLLDHGKNELQMAAQLDPLNFEKHENYFMSI